MHDQRFLDLGREEIAATIVLMPQTFTTAEFLTCFQRRYPELRQLDLDLCNL